MYLTNFRILPPLGKSITLVFIKEKLGFAHNSGVDKTSLSMSGANLFANASSTFLLWKPQSGTKSAWNSFSCVADNHNFWLIVLTFWINLSCCMSYCSYCAEAKCSSMWLKVLVITTIWTCVYMHCPFKLLCRSDQPSLMQNWKHHRIEKDAAADRRVIPTSFHLDCGAIAPTT